MIQILNFAKRYMKKTKINTVPVDVIVENHQQRTNSRLVDIKILKTMIWVDIGVAINNFKRY